MITDNNVPDWYNPYERVSISSYKSWSEVAAWAVKLFQVSEKDRQRIKNEVLPTLDSNSEEAFVLKATRFVQDEIRYLGFETGLNSLKPHSPAKVYDQRFGDCKDKSVLLTALLNAKGIEAYPVLVSTTLRDKISEELPSVGAFNHCVVQVKIPGNTFYIDPTINDQGGKLDNYYFPAYGKGLVISSATTDLVTFPDLVASSTSEVQTFEIASVGGEGILSVHTTYTGREADSQRSYFSSNTLESIQKSYLTYYGNLYPDIEKVETIQLEDNREGNILIVKEKYRIPTFWKLLDDNENVLYCEFYPQTLESYFNVSKSAQRIAPYRLAHPLEYNHEIRINIPEEWNIAPNQVNIENDYYQYDYAVSYAAREVLISTRYRTKASHVPVSAFGTFVDDHEKMMGYLSYTLTYDKSVVAAGSKKWPGIVVSLLVLALGIWLTLWLYHNYDPQPHYPAVWGIPIGGWLVLPAIGITLSPFRLAYDFIVSPEVISGEGWLASLVLGRYDLFASLLVLHIFNILNLLFTVLVLVLLYQRRSSAPRMIIIFYAARCIFTTFDAIIAGQLLESTEGNLYKDMFQSILTAAIWIPYFHISLRVKKTFVNVYRGSDDSGDLVAQPVVADPGIPNDTPR